MLEVVHYGDPGCPWGYSSWPFFTALQWRYGDQLQWRNVMIGLTESGAVYEARGYTPARQAQGYMRFRFRGMPFATGLRERIPGTQTACRAVVATRLTQPELELAAFRALQFGWFTTARLMDTEDAIAAQLATVPGLDADMVVGMLQAHEVTETYETDRAEARTAAGSPTEFQGKSATTDGPVRFTAPSLIFRRPDGRSLEAGGYQSFEAYDVCVANLDTSLERRPPAEDAGELLAAFPFGLTTREVAACMAPDKFPPDDEAAEVALVEATAAGRAHRAPLGDGALWTTAAEGITEVRPPAAA